MVILYRATIVIENICVLTIIIIILGLSGIRHAVWKPRDM